MFHRQALIHRGAGYVGHRGEEQEMAEYDRYENEGGGGFMMGLLTGTVIGAGIGMLLAPKAGSDLRGQVASRREPRHQGVGAVQQGLEKASEQFNKASEAASGWAEKGREWSTRRAKRSIAAPRKRAATPARHRQHLQQRHDRLRRSLDDRRHRLRRS